MKFDLKFHFFLHNLYYNHSASYNDDKYDSDRNFAPMLEDPTSSDNRGKIAFYLLLDGGYLTRADRNDKTLFKITNDEIRGQFSKIVRSYRKEIPLDQKAISKLLDATVNENVQSFGEEITRSLHSLYLMRLAKEEHPYEKAIHELLIAYLEDLKEFEEYKVIG
jgi:hypothetical protein